MFTHLDNISSVDLTNPVNKSHDLNKDRLGWWLTLPGLAGGRLWYDLVGSNHGSLIGFSSTSGWRADARPGSFGSIAMVGAQYVDCGNSDARLNFTTGNFAISFWANFSSLGTSPVILNRGIYQTSGWYIFISTAGQMFFQCESAGVDNSISTASGAVVAGLWHHYILVRTGTTTGAIYKDGQLLTTTGSLGNCASSTNPLQFGQYNGGSNRAGCNLDDVSLWNRSLSAQEVFELYNLSKMGYPGLLNRLSQTTVYCSLISVLLAGDVSSTFSTSASLGTSAILAGNNTVVFSDAGTLVVSSSLLAAINASESGTGTLTVTTPGINALAGDVTSLLSLTASMGVSDRLLGSILVNESGSGTLTVSTPGSNILAGSATVAFNTGGTLTVASSGAIHLNGNATGVFVARGTVTVGRQTGPVLFFYKKAGAGRGFIRS